MAGLPPKNGKSDPHCWGRLVSTQFAVCNRRDSYTACRLSRLEPIYIVKSVHVLNDRHTMFSDFSHFLNGETIRGVGMVVGKINRQLITIVTINIVLILKFTFNTQYYSFAYFHHNIFCSFLIYTYSFINTIHR